MGAAKEGVTPSAGLESVTGTEPLDTAGVLCWACTDKPVAGSAGGGDVVGCGGRDHTTVRIEVDHLDTGGVSQLNGAGRDAACRVRIADDQSPGDARDTGVGRDVAVAGGFAGVGDQVGVRADTVIITADVVVHHYRAGGRAGPGQHPGQSVMPRDRVQAGTGNSVFEFLVGDDRQ